MEILYSIPAWQIALVFFALLIAAIESGYGLGCRAGHESDSSDHGTFLGVMGAVLGLLSLLLAFSFSMAATRYELRKHVLVEEANAVGTSYLRTSLLADPAQSQMRKVLRAYLAARQAQYDPEVAAAPAQQAAAKSERLQTELWEIAAAEARRDPHSFSAAQVVQAVNDLIDTAGARNAAYRNHVPEIVLLLLLAISLVSGVLVGHAFGRMRQRNFTATIAFAALTTVVLFTLFDLDRPRRGLIQASQGPIVELQADVQLDR